MIDGIYTLDDVKLKGKLILARFDMNSPLDPKTREPIDITRIRECLPTIKELTDKGAKTVILIHQGSDIEYHNYSSVKPHSRIISELLNKPVDYIDDVCGPAARNKIKSMENGQILMLENVRYMAEEMTLFETKLNLTPEEQANTIVVQKLGPIADLYLCDAFAAAHRAQPTLIGMEEILPSVMGRLLEKEILSLNRLLKNPAKPCVFILGGAKIQDAFLMINSIFDNNIADLVLATGLVAHVMLLAKSTSLGKESEEFIKKKNLGSYIEMSKEILNMYHDKIKLPIDFAYNVLGKRMEIEVDNLPINDYPLTDLGIKTINYYNSIIEQAKTVFFNGPAGVFEEEASELGTKSLLTAIANSNAFSALGGGDTITALNRYALVEKMSYVSTGGGALIRFLSGEELPVIKALKKSSKKFKITKK
jgi:phosphoglycerate kinase